MDPYYGKAIVSTFLPQTFRTSLDNCASSTVCGNINDAGSMTQCCYDCLAAFYNQYGTHYISGLTFGGSITSYVETCSETANTSTGGSISGSPAGPAGKASMLSKLESSLNELLGGASASAQHTALSTVSGSSSSCIVNGFGQISECSSLLGGLQTAVNNLAATAALLGQDLTLLSNLQGLGLTSQEAQHFEHFLNLLLQSSFYQKTLPPPPKTTCSASFLAENWILNIMFLGMVVCSSICFIDLDNMSC